MTAPNTTKAKLHQYLEDAGEKGLTLKELSLLFGSSHYWQDILQRRVKCGEYFKISDKYYSNPPRAFAQEVKWEIPPELHGEISQVLLHVESLTLDLTGIDSEDLVNFGRDALQRLCFYLIATKRELPFSHKKDLSKITSAMNDLFSRKMNSYRDELLS